MPRRPIPVEVLERRGSTKVYQKRAAGIPDKVQGQVTRPSWLGGEAARVWNELLPMLTEMRVMARTDKNVLAMYCEMWARWRECNEFVEKHGTTYVKRERSTETDTDGNPIPGAIKTIGTYPQARMLLQYADRLVKLGSQLGLSPASRSMLSVIGKQISAPGGTSPEGLPPPEDSKERFF